MIAYVSGQPQIVDEYVIVHTASGVGYRVFVGPITLGNLTSDQVSFYTFAYIKEDKFELYGFPNLGDLRLFELLVSVSGCGPKTAINLADAGSHRVIEAIQQANVSFFTSFPRVGKKLAQKLIIDLKNKLGGLKDLDLSPKSQTYNDVSAALLTLGFAENQIDPVLAHLDLEQLTTSEAIKQALKKLK